MFDVLAQEDQKRGYIALKKVVDADFTCSLDNGKTLEFIKSKVNSDHDNKQPYLVLVLPGGGYEFTSYMESYQVANAFAKEGFDSALFRYSTNREDEVKANGHGLGFLPLQEVAQAIDELRHNDSLGFTKHKIIVCGFSAGGHLASCISTMYEHPILLKNTSLRGSVRPDGSILCYPVISAKENLAHFTSFYFLTGSADPKVWQEFSTEYYVNDKTPPAFVWTTANDETVNPLNAVAYAQAMWDHHNIADLRVFPRGRHGCSLARPEVTATNDFFLADPYKAVWFEQACSFIRTFC